MMKKLVSLALFALFALMLVKCGETYEESTAADFSGVWVFEKGNHFRNNVVIDTIKIKTFIQVRSGMIIFFNNGLYDSSFFYREDVNTKDIYTRKIKDSVKVVIKYEKRDSTGKVMIDSITKLPIILTDTVMQPQKPTNPNAEYATEKYFATRTFEGDRMILTKYINNQTKTDETMTYKAYFYRPKN